MARKQKNDYFELAKAQTAHCVEAAELLVQILDTFSYEKIEEYKTTMHAIEHRADQIHHDILHRLSAEFITPIDQEDILGLVQIVDNITDALDEVVMGFYTFCIDTVPPHAIPVSRIVLRCVNSLHAAMGELKNFKKPQVLREHLIETNTIESEADAAYIEALHDLFSTETDSRRLIGYKAVYDCLESCCDLCEHAADAVERIIIKNT